MMVGASTSIRCLYPCPKACLPLAEPSKRIVLFNCQYGFVQPISISATSPKTSVLPTLFLVVTNLVENQNAGKKLGTDTPQNQFCAKQEMCCFSAVKFGTPAAKIPPQMELATYCKCIIPTATSRRNFRLGRGNLILKLWLLLLNDNCDFWANILSQIMVSTIYSGSQESEVWGQVLCPCPMP